jgi:DNA-binding transcriptional LysR family regulator
VSQRIGDLEDQLGVSLFERQPGRGIHLTAAGRRFLPDARRVLFEANRAIENASRAGRAETGDFVLGFGMSLSSGWLREAVTRFRRIVPEVAVTFIEDNSIELQAGVIDRRLNLALVAHHRPDPRIGSLPLWSERLHVVVPAAHPLARRELIEWTDLLELPLVIRTWESASPAYQFVARRLRSGMDHSIITQHIVSPDSLIAIAAAGFGLAIVPESATGVPSAEIAFKPIAGADALIPISAIWLPSAENPVVGRFVRLLQEVATPAGRGQS